jgi:GNAT superfamily N-acetyltransferase
MNADITIRPATLEDLPVILHHRREMFRSMQCDPAVLESLELAVEKYFKNVFEAGRFHGWLAVNGDGKIVGGGGIVDVAFPPSPFAPDATRPEIINVYVEPQYRHRGIARRLIQVMVDWCRARGATLVQLTASDDGRPLYTSMGFEPTREMKLRLKQQL